MNFYYFFHGAVAVYDILPSKHTLNSNHTQSHLAITCYLLPNGFAILHSVQ